MLEPTINLIRISGGLRGMEERNRCVDRHGQQRVENGEKAWEFLMEAMQGQSVEERMHGAGWVEGSWTAGIAWDQLQGDADMPRGIIWRKFKNIAMQGDEDPRLFFSRAEGKPNVFSALGIQNSDGEVVHMLISRLPPEVYDVEQRNSLFRPGITPLEMEKVVRTSHADLKKKASGDR